MGQIFGRWLIASVALGAVSGGAYGALVASTLGSPNEAALVSDAPVALVLGIGLGLGSLFGIVVGGVLGAMLGVVMAATNRTMQPDGQLHYIKRVRVLAVIVPFVGGVGVLAITGRLLTLDVLPVAVASVLWGLAAKKIAEGYRSAWPPAAQR